MATVLIVTPLLWFGTGGLGGVDHSFAGQTALVLAATSLIGCGLLMWTALKVVAIGSRATTCVHRGYTWLTVLEVVCDVRGDTGAVIEGANEYSELTPATRSSIRSSRVMKAACALAAAVMPLVAFVLVAWMSGGGFSLMAFAPLFVFGPSVALLAIRAFVARVERRATRAARAARERTVAQLGASQRVIGPWYAQFDEVSAGQWFGKGRAGGSLLGFFVGGVIAVASIGVTVVAASLLILGAGGQEFIGDGIWFTNSTPSRMARALQMRRYGVPTDTSITPDSAGATMYALTATSQTMLPPYVRRPNKRYPMVPPPTDTLFGRASRAYLTLYRTILERATKPLTPAEREYLERVGTDSVWPAYSVVARAGRMDVAGAVLKLPLPHAMSPYDVPMLSLSASRDLAYQNVVRAAWFLSNGRLADAEHALRETISFGLRMIDNANPIMWGAMGASVVGIGRDALLRLYTITGATSEVRRIESIDSIESRGGTRIARPAAVQRMLDEKQPRQDRWDLVTILARAPCGNLREMLFGTSQSLREAFATARASLARTEAEAELFDAYAGVLDRMPPPAAPHPLGFVASIPATILGNPRITRCAALSQTR